MGDLISPDVFRRSLLDFDSLGPHHKYAGIFTRHERDSVDHKQRAWKRGLEIGRYKPVADLLSHNLDAHSGMRGGSWRAP